MEVQQTIVAMTFSKLHISPAHLILHRWSPDEVDEQKIHIVGMLLSLAKLEIASKWKSKTPPSLTNWYEKIWENFVSSKNNR